MRRTLLFTLTCLSLTLAACNGDKDGGADDTAADGGSGGDDTGSDGGDGEDGGDGDGGSGVDCPDEVPEDYRNIWDCGAESCPGGTLIYRYAEGSSDDEGNIEVAESWYLFSASDWCTDSFSVAGDYEDSIDPATFNCSECEEIWDVTWTLETGNSCGLAWGSLFVDDAEQVEGPFEGYLMFDTHGSLSGRNPDNAALVIAAHVEGSTYYPQPDWAEGTAEPTSSADGPPEDYIYVSDAICAGGSASPTGPTVRLPEREDLRELRVGESLSP